MEQRERWSEHALGNAIDFSGLRFDALPRTTTSGAANATDWAATLPPGLRGSFTLDIRRDHLHLDMGPWAYLRL